MDGSVKWLKRKRGINMSVKKSEKFCDETLVYDFFLNAKTKETKNDNREKGRCGKSSKKTL